MSANISRVYLEDRQSKQLIEASLYDCIQPRHLDDLEQLWKCYPRVNDEQHGHWDWRKKMRILSGQLSYRSFALECLGETQGLMIVNTIKRCRISQQANKHLVYLEYVEAAPWNRKSLGGSPRYKGVGSVLVAAAIQLSIEEGNRGRIGLHALPQAESFYRNVCGMTDLGPDSLYYPKFPLRYFEMTESQAKAFM